MDSITLLFDTLKIIIPALLVFLTAYFVLKQFLDNESNKRAMEIRRDNNKTAMPLRLQAYERMTLFLERLNPNNMIVRAHRSGMTARDLQSALLGEIRAEYEHNLTQQLYVSKRAWDVVRSVKEETINMINNATMGLPAQATGMDLSRVILEHLAKQEQNPFDIAVAIMKSEIQKLF